MMIVFFKLFFKEKRKLLEPSNISVCLTYPVFFEDIINPLIQKILFNYIAASMSLFIHLFYLTFTLVALIESPFQRHFSDRKI